MKKTLVDFTHLLFIKQFMRRKILTAFTMLSLSLLVSCDDDALSDNDNAGGDNGSPQKEQQNTSDKNVGDTNGFAFVDLNLPSGNLWATMNLGASTIQAFGDVYSWGETEIKESWSNGTYKFYKTDGDAQGHTKYVPQDQAEKYGFKGFYDNTIVLTMEDDAAHVVMGGSWRIPSTDDWKELKDNCEGVFCEYEDVVGYKFTAKNGEWIFLPAAGIGDWSARRYENKYGYYWANSVRKEEPSAGSCFTFNSMASRVYGNFRYDGSSVRAVCPTK